MAIIQTDRLTAEDQEALRAIWNNEYPEKLRLETPEDFERYLDNLADKTHYLVTNDAGLLGWAFTFLRDDNRWFAMILDRSIHGKGTGSELLNRMKSENHSLFGWVIDHSGDQKADGSPYPSPLDFYRKNGFEVDQEIRLELPTISAVRISWLSTKDTKEATSGTAG
jgi:GNAT superfamily N-acetyltransferase